MQGQLCVVTGATDGIGRITARALAERGAEVVLVGRNAAKGAEVCKAIERSSRNDRVRFEQAELSSQAEIRALAERLTAGGAAIDVLVNNVGAIFNRRRESTDGIEMTFALNHLGYFLLTGLLLESLKESAAARIVNVASEAHRGGRMDLEDPQGMETAAKQARELGFSGKGAIHPKQIPALNAVFTPDAAQIERARRIIRTFEEADTGLVVIDGQLIEKPVLRDMHRVLAIAERISA